MSYSIMFEEWVINFDDYGVPVWLRNSYASLGRGWDTAEVEYIDKQYEQKFNVKVLYGQLDSDGAFGTFKDTGAISGVEFPSQEEATMFLLRWS